MLSHTWIPREGPTILLLHGIAADRRQLEALWELPASILAPDLPGHGENAGIIDDPLEDSRQGIIELLRHHDIEEPIIIGYSLGGYIAQYIAGRGVHPRALVFIATSAHLPFEQVLTKFRLLEKAEPLLERYEDFVEQAVDAYRKLRGQERVKMEGRLDVKTMLRFLEQLERTDINTECCRLGVPCLVVHGKTDYIIPVGLGKTLAKRMPGAKMKILDTDHNAIVQDARAIQAIERFVKQI